MCIGQWCFPFLCGFLLVNWVSTICIDQSRNCVIFLLFFSCVIWYHPHFCLLHVYYFFCSVLITSNPLLKMFLLRTYFFTWYLDPLVLHTSLIFPFEYVCPSHIEWFMKNKGSIFLFITSSDSFSWPISFGHPSRDTILNLYIFNYQ